MQVMIVVLVSELRGFNSLKKIWFLSIPAFLGSLVAGFIYSEIKVAGEMAAGAIMMQGSQLVRRVNDLKLYRDFNVDQYELYLVCKIDREVSDIEILIEANKSYFLNTKKNVNFEEKSEGLVKMGKAVVLGYSGIGFAESCDELLNDIFLSEAQDGEG